MKFGSGALLVAVGLLVLWLAVSGKLSNLSGAWDALNGEPRASDVQATNNAAGSQMLSQLVMRYPAEAFPTLPVSPPTLSLN